MHIYCKFLRFFNTVLRKRKLFDFSILFIYFWFLFFSLEEWYQDLKQSKWSILRDSFCWVRVCISEQSNEKGSPGFSFCTSGNGYVPQPGLADGLRGEPSFLPSPFPSLTLKSSPRTWGTLDHPGEWPAVTTAAPGHRPWSQALLGTGEGRGKQGSNTAGFPGARFPCVSSGRGLESHVTCAGSEPKLGWAESQAGNSQFTSLPFCPVETDREG